MKISTKSALAGLLVLSASHAWATDGTIEFTGAILDSTCEFAAEDDIVHVELGHYAANQFKQVGDKSPTTPFSIPLINCPTTAWKHLDGREDASFRLWLETRDGSTIEDAVNERTLVSVASMSGDAAEGVGIQIEAPDGTPMQLNKLTDDVIFPITAEAMNLNLQAYYVSTVESKDIAPGVANALVDVTIDYR